MNRRVLAIALHASLVAVCSTTSLEAQATSPAQLPSILKLPAPPTFNDLLVSPNGKFVLRSRQDSVDLVEIATGRRIPMADGASSAITWSPRGDRIAWTRWEEQTRPSIWTITVDPNTGAARSKPQRVSVGTGDVPAISFDGQRIAYATSAEGATTPGFVPRRIVVVPVTGGPEQTIATTTRYIEVIYWGPNGRELFLGGGSPDTMQTALTRVSLDNGTLQVLSRDSAWVSGASANRAFFVMMPWGMAAGPQSFATVVDNSGKRIGRVQIPVGQRIYYAGMMRDSAAVLVRWEDKWGLESRLVSGGAARALPAVGESNFAPRFSPDGQWILFAVEQHGERHLAISKPDGSSARQFPNALVRNDAFGAFWSPDSRSIAYQSPDRRRLALLDVQTGQSRTILPTDAPQGILQWRPDGQGFITYLPQEGVQVVSLSGQKRTLVSDAVVSAMKGSAVRATAQGLALRSDSAITLYPYDGSAPRRAALPTMRGASSAAVSADGKQLVVLVREQSGNAPLSKLEIISLPTLTRRVVDLPFRLGPGHDPAFADNDRAVLVLGDRPGDTGRHIFSVPLDGSKPTIVGSTNSFQLVASFNVSPDGRTVIYPAQRSMSRSLVALDLRPALKQNGASRSGN